MHKLIVFDLDGTLAESKQSPDETMVDLFTTLLNLKKVAIISGGSFSQFQKQFISALNYKDNVNYTNLILLPGCGTSYYSYTNNEWVKKYSENFSVNEKEKIFQAFETVLNIDRNKSIYGKLLEDRESQITFSALGQDAPVKDKILYDQDHSIRKDIVLQLKNILPEFDIHIGGMTSIDVTKLGRDKAFGIEKLITNEGLSTKEILFIGDSLFEGGNDYSVIKTGINTLSVKNPEETRDIIKNIINQG